MSSAFVFFDDLSNLFLFVFFLLLFPSGLFSLSSESSQYFRTVVKPPAISRDNHAGRRILNSTEIKHKTVTKVAVFKSFKYWY